MECVVVGCKNNTLNQALHCAECLNIKFLRKEPLNQICPMGCGNETLPGENLCEPCRFAKDRAGREAQRQHIREVGPLVPTKSDGSTASYYELPKGATQLQDLIGHKDMNAQIGEIFRACYRYGEVEHSEKMRDAKKIKFYAEAEIARLEKL